jgi:hypothetical protein
MTTNTLDDAINQVWSEHGDDLRAAVVRLDAVRGLLDESPDKLGDFVDIAEHVLLGHLADVDTWASWLAHLAPLVERHVGAQAAFDRAHIASRLLRGGSAKPGEAALPLLIRAHGTAANGAAARGDVARARELLECAIALARDGGDDADAVKALAASSNNLATQLLDGPRGPAADALMMEAATLSRSRWGEVGTWLHAERGEYILALCAAAVGDGAKATGHARECLAICKANDADAFERFFGHEALGRSRLACGDRIGMHEQLGAMRALIGTIAEDLRVHAHAALAGLERDSTA